MQVECSTDWNDTAFAASKYSDACGSMTVYEKDIIAQKANVCTML